jgi:1-aminocyclopropane-1-carboxylate synthase
VHIVFGFSKDFCGSGLRLGVLYSKNSALNMALGNLGYFCSVPAPLQMTLSKLLADDAWVDGFVAENRRRMLQAYTSLTGMYWHWSGLGGGRCGLCAHTWG